MSVTESKRVTVVVDLEFIEAAIDIDMWLMFREAASSTQAVTKLS